MAKDIKLVYWDTDDTTYVSFPQNNTITIGKDNLIQYIIKKLLTMKGSNGFELTIGSNFLHLPGGAYGGAASQTFKTNLSLAIKDLEAEIKRAQSEAEDNGDTFTDAEKLNKLRLRSSKFIISTGQWKVKLDVFTNDDDVLTISLPI
jgi:hypothetical protein